MTWQSHSVKARSVWISFTDSRMGCSPSWKVGGIALVDIQECPPQSKTKRRPMAPKRCKHLSFLYFKAVYGHPSSRLGANWVSRSKRRPLSAKSSCALPSMLCHLHLLDAYAACYIYIHILGFGTSGSVASVPALEWLLVAGSSRDLEEIVTTCDLCLWFVHSL